MSIHGDPWWWAGYASPVCHDTVSSMHVLGSNSLERKVFIPINLSHWVVFVFYKALQGIRQLLELLGRW